MKSPLDRMNLRPAERRLVVGVALMLFFMVNLWLVFPHFSDLKKVQNRIAKARKTQALFQTEINQMGFYQARLKELESESLNVPIEEQNTHFANTREGVAAQSGVTLLNSSRVQSSTNQFFVELTQTINLQPKEQPLVDFLYNLGSGNSLIRVRDLSLRPSPSQQELTASVKLAASYQKKPLPRVAAAVQVAGTPPPAATNSVMPSTATAPPRTTPGMLAPAGKAATTQPAPKSTPKKS
jgi:hypothetical protein